MAEIAVWHTAIEEASGQYDLFRLLKEITLAYGYKHFSVMKLPDDALSRLEQLSVVSNWPPELIKEYDEKGLLQSSPIMKALRSSNKPYTWELESMNAERDVAERNIAQELFKAFDFLSGVGFPCTATNGLRGAVSFAGDKKDALDAGMIAQLSLTASLIFDQLIQFDNTASEKNIELSERETQCLTHMAGGLATGQIAAELGISEHTVNHHIGVLIQKLRAKNRAHAVSLGFRLQLLR